MKIYLSILACTILYPFQSFSQTNLSFENWVNQGNYYDPAGWLNPNFTVLIGGNPSCLRTEPHWGNYSIGITPTIVPGIGNISGFVLQQFAYSKRPKSVSLYYKYSSKTSDQAAFLVEFSKGSTTDSSNPIGEASIFLPYKDKWTFMETNILWHDNTIPDSASIFITNSPANTSDTLLVDDIGISMFGTNVWRSLKPVFNIYLNSDKFLILDPALNNTKCKVIIRNVLGQKVFDDTTVNSFINLNDLPEGIYVYEITPELGEVISGKFIR